MSERTPAITGLGVISSLAPTLAGHWQRVLERATGIHELEGPPRASAHRWAGRVDDDALPPDLPPEIQKQGRLINQGSRLALRAVDEAVRVSGVELSGIPPARRALYIGALDDERVAYRDFYAAMREAEVGGEGAVDEERVSQATLRTVDPFFILKTLSNNLVAFVSRRYQLQGPNTTLASHAPAGAQALELAAQVLRLGEADVAVVVGTCVWNPFVSLLNLDALGVLSRCDDRAASFRPFDRERDGLIPGDGAAALVLEPLTRARARGARVLGVVRGSASFTDTGDGGQPGSGPRVTAATVRRTAASALEDAGLRAADLAFVAAHGIGTREGDRAEMDALAQLLEGSRPPVTGLKPYTGYMGAASDLAEIALALTGLGHGLAPATLNFRAPDAGLEHVPIAAEHTRVAARHALAMSQGLAGQSVAIVVSAGDA